MAFFYTGLRVCAVNIDKAEHPTNRNLSRTEVLAIAGATFVGHAIFALNTDLESLGLGSAGDPDNWALWRHVTVAGWLSLAMFVFLVRKTIATMDSFAIAATAAAAVALVLTGMWVEEGAKYAIIGSAITYSVISGLLCITLKNKILAGLLGAVFMLVQWLTDVVVLGLAGEFRIH